ncbi:MAG: type II toxin-antitoxin system RelE/ParE family toxin [Bacteroides sp.]|nr:type II toxin-antitoxin system RelE/ParE family toxin [Bacteroides sp.]
MVRFQLLLLDEAKDFLQGLPMQAYKKILYNIDRVAGGEKNSELFKKLENSEIWEFRTLYNGVAYRLFAFWDTERQTLVVATHGIIKKAQKTPRKEIARAEILMKKYFELKKSKVWNR